MESLDTIHNLIAYPKPYTTRILRGNLLKNYLAPLNKRGFFQLQKDAIVGGLLGDGSLQYNGKSLPYYKFDQKASRKEYVDLIYSIFDEYVGTPPKPRIKNGRIDSYSFRTYRLIGLDFYAKQFYTQNSLGNREKIVPNLIHRWLNPQSLAFWFMDDGSKDHGGGYRLHTEGFSRPNILKLQKAIGSIFNLQSNLQKGNLKLVKEPNQSKQQIYENSFFLYIPVSDSQRFHDIIEPYMIDCMKYKLHQTASPSS